ncbi:MAG: fibronectin type III domain-containing protein, partial [bacterium]
RIYRATDAGVHEGLLLASVAGAGVSTYQDAAVASGIRYFYRVKAVDVLDAVSFLSAEASAQACPAGTDYLLGVTGPISAGMGSTVTYAITLNNLGSTTLTNLVVSDTISAVVTSSTGMQPAGLSGPAVTSVASGTRYVWSVLPSTIVRKGHVQVGSSAAVASLAFPTPPGTTAGDLIVTFLSVDGSPTITDPLGWTSLGQVNSLAPHALRVIYKVATAADIGGTNTWSFTSGRAAGVILSYAGVDAAIPVDAAGFVSDSVTGTTHSTFDITTTVPNDLLVTCMTVDVQGSTTVSNWTPDPAMTEIAEAASTGGAPNAGVAVEVAEQARPGAGSTGTRSATDPQAGYGASYAVALRPGPSLRPGQVWTFTITGTIGMVCGASLTIGDTAWADAGAACSGIQKQSAVSPVTVTGWTTTITATKSQVPAAPGQGQSVTYRIDVTNNGTATIVSVTVTDTISPVVTSATTQAPSAFAGPAVASVASGTRFVWSASSLAFTQGQTYSFTITGVIGTVGATTQVSNTAYASASSMCSLARMQTNSVGVLVTNGTPPGAPASLTSRGQNEQVYLNWAPATPGTYPVTSYSIYRATCSGCPSSLLVSVSSATTEYTNTGLANGTTYEYKVQAVDTSFNAGPFSSTATGTPLDANLNPPTCLTAIQLGASNRVMISWCFSPPATHPATGYGIYRTTFAGFDITPGAVAVVEAGASLFTDTLLTTGTFWYHVR